MDTSTIKRRYFGRISANNDDLGVKLSDEEKELRNQVFRRDLIAFVDWIPMIKEYKKGMRKCGIFHLFKVGI